MDLRHLYPRRGDDVLRWWEKVIDWAKTLRIEPAPGSLISNGPDGAQIVFREKSPLRTPFRCGLTGSRVRVSPGYIGERVPFIADPDSGEWIRLDGTTADGVTSAPRPVPSLELTGEQPGADGRGAIVVRLQVDARGIPLDDRETPAALQVAYVAEFDAAARRELAREQVAIEPLAIIYWSADGKTPERCAQIVRHNLVHSYAAASADGEPGRHFFSAR